jgi:hypothetical protein
MQRPMVHDTVASLGELERDFELLARRYVIMGFPRLKVWYTDNCCADRPVIEKAFAKACAVVGATMEGDGEQPSPVPAYPALCFPAECQPALLMSNSKDLVANACRLLREAAVGFASRNSLAPVLGVNIVWDTSAVGAPFPAVIMLAALDGTAFSFHTKIGNTECIPDSLVEVLEAGSLNKVGFALDRDAQYLSTSSEVVIHPIKNLPGLALQVVNTCADGTAAGMAAQFLQRTLPPVPPGTLWTNRNLSTEAVTLA